MIHFTRHVNGQLVVHESNEGIGQVRHAAPSRDIAKCAWSDFRVPDAPSSTLCGCGPRTVDTRIMGPKCTATSGYGTRFSTMAWVDRRRYPRNVQEEEEGKKVESCGSQRSLEVRVQRSTWVLKSEARLLYSRILAFHWPPP